MAHLERRRQLWYAILTIPADLREHFGKLRFIQSTGTPDKRTAEIVAAPLVARWKALIQQARGVTNPLLAEALKWKRDIESQNGDGFQREAIEGILEDRARELEKAKGEQAADSFFKVATGQATLSANFFDQWKSQIKLAPKTTDQMVKDVGVFVAHFPTLQEISKKSVKAWMDDLARKGKSASSQKRILSFCKNYWKYLQTHDEVPVDFDPFTGVLAFSKSKKGNAGGSWLPFSADEVVSLWKKANEIGDQQLADLIFLDAYTGARIEELCSIRVADVTNDALKITDSKTIAGIREVPTHPALTPLIKRLKKNSEDGYLLSGLTFNKYNDRSNAIGKRFGRLKKAAGFGNQHVFHSIRKTLTTLLENAGVSENLAADIVGHEKPRITYGLYSGGASLNVKREAIERVRYEFGEG
jgi:integrase